MALWMFVDITIREGSVENGLEFAAWSMNVGTGILMTLQSWHRKSCTCFGFNGRW
jgi:hypothetical protein